MSHSLHRRGSCESLKDDYVLLVTPSVGINNKGSAEFLWKILDIVQEVGPDNLGSYETGTIFTGATVEEIRTAMGDTPRVRCCFDSREKMFEVLKRIKALDAGLSVVISGLNDEVLDMAKELELKPHSVNYSLGIHGRTDKLPPEEVLEFVTMCGHGMVSKNLVIENIEAVRAGRKKIHDAAVAIAQPCVCGIFNVDRAEKLLEKFCKTAE